MVEEADVAEEVVAGVEEADGAAEEMSLANSTSPVVDAGTAIAAHSVMNSSMHEKDSFPSLQ